MPDAHVDQGEVVHEGWLLKSREPLMKLPFIRSNKWVKRYFVLRSGSPTSQCRLDQYHDERKRKRTKSVNLDQCTQVDSYLRMTHQDRQWIFSMHLNKREVYLAAENEEQMNRWVSDLCYACNLERQESNSPVQFDGYGDEPCLTAGVSFDSVLSTPNTEEQNIDNMFAERLHEEDEESERLCSFEFPPVAKSQGNSGSNRHQQNYLHISSCSSSSSSGAQSVGQQGYVHLAQCISAQPRPIGKKGTTPTSGALTLPLAPPAPMHQRGPSSDSTASSQRSISVSDNESSLHTPSTPNLDVVPPPPRPPKVNATHSQPHHSYSNDQPKKILPPGYDVPTLSGGLYLNQRPPAPAPVDEEGSSAETIKPPAENEEGDSYINMPTNVDELQSPAPTVDRSKKPSRSAKHLDGDVSDKDDNGPLKPHAVRINRIDSFVKKNSPAPTPNSTPQTQPHDRQIQVPKMLPKTNPGSRMTAAQIIHSPIASPMATRQPNARQQLEYIDPSFAAMPSPLSARTPSPRTGAATEPIHTFGSPSKVNPAVNYAVINEKATKAIGATISQSEASRTLDRKKN